MKLCELLCYFSKFNGDTEITIDDPDTGCILKISSIELGIEKESNKEVLILISKYEDQIYMV
jgi:hypothetical protein